MGMFIQADDGTGSFFPAEVGTHLLTITNFDTGYGEAPPSGELVAVSYARSNSGPPPERLDDLVNNAAYTNDTRIRGVDNNFNVPGVGLISNFAGVAIEVGDANNPFPNTQLTYYDVTENGGAGYPACDTSNNPIPSPGPIVLYHELSHIHDYHNNVATTEFDAMTDENELRTQMGTEFGQRDPNNHGGCGTATTTCCVVASIATGWPRSPQLHELRKVRDRLLRRSAVGFEFFEALFRDYYYFSPEACRLLGQNSQLSRLVRDRLVDPLVIALRLVDSWRPTPPAPSGAALQFERERSAHPALAALSVAELEWSVAALRSVATGATDSRLEELGMPAEVVALARRVPRSAAVMWAFVEPITLTYSALLEHAKSALLDSAGLDRRDGSQQEQLESGHRERGQRLLAAFEGWSAGLPLTPGWQRWTCLEIEQQLRFLSEVLLLTSRSRARFRTRMLGELEAGPEVPAGSARPAADDPRLLSSLERWGYFGGEYDAPCH
ncbi:MAG TPA: hypothetical protein VFQ61_23445 [Polyangiaceae bacterium]|nr:hypothetical protein [Polyangiaceae bacterium]